MRNAMRGHGAAAAADGDVTMRAVEAGARLVAAPAAGMTAVLQMPRGNLEAICPRPLALEALADALDVSCPASLPPAPTHLHDGLGVLQALLAIIQEFGLHRHSTTNMSHHHAD